MPNVLRPDTRAPVPEGVRGGQPSLVGTPLWPPRKESPGEKARIRPPTRCIRADRHRSARADELPITDYDDLNVPQAVAAIKELATVPADVRAILAYEESHKNRQGVVSAAQTRVAAIAQEVVGNRLSRAAR